MANDGVTNMSSNADKPKAGPEVGDPAFNPQENLSGDKNPTVWVSHPIDIRVSLPLMHRRFYFTFVAGQERRRKERLCLDRQTYPLMTAGNVFFSLGLATLFSIAALFLLIAQSAIIE